MEQVAERIVLLKSLGVSPVAHGVSAMLDLLASSSVRRCCR
jgi:hypothetical protein